jgi:hypothetical protein
MKPYRVLSILGFLLSSCGMIGPQLTVTPSSAVPTLPGALVTSPTPSNAVATQIAGPSGLSIEMYALSGPPSTEPLTFDPVQGTQAQIYLNNQAIRDQDPVLRLDLANKTLQPFGYKIETNPPADITTANTYTITKDSVSLFHQAISGFLPVSVNADGTDFMMVVDAADGGYLVSTQGVQKGGMGLGSGFPAPVFLKNDVLTAMETYSDTANGSNGSVTVNLGSREIFSTSVGLPSPVTALRGLWSDGANWILEVARAKGNADTFQVIGEIYQNGISYNQKYAYQASFQYQLLGGKPFFFYQKNDQIGISYDGQEIPLGIEEIPHYGCCSGAELNPRQYSSLIDFFARKGQAWYFVEVSGK